MPRQPTRVAPRRTRARPTQRQRIEALSRTERAAYQRTLTAIKRMRRGVPLTLAAVDAGTNPNEMCDHIVRMTSRRFGKECFFTKEVFSEMKTVIKK